MRVPSAVSLELSNTVETDNSLDSSANALNSVVSSHLRIPLPCMPPIGPPASVPRAMSAPLLAACRRRDGCSPTNATPHIELHDVNPLWLQASPNERFLLLEDTETGDVLMPLIYMKAVFEANYSRKLSSMKNRLVVLPPDEAAGPATMYWHWAFESPHSVKVIVRKELGEENTPQGHLRLVLLPIVYNALSQKEEQRGTALFAALHQAMKASSYYPLLRHPPKEPEPISGTIDGDVASGENPLFYGPRDLFATAAKYMSPSNSGTDDSTDIGAKRSRCMGSAPDMGAAAKAANEPRAKIARLESEVESLRQESRVMREDLLVVKNCLMHVFNYLLPQTAAGGLQPGTIQEQLQQQLETPRQVPEQHQVAPPHPRSPASMDTSADDISSNTAGTTRPAHSSQLTAALHASLHLDVQDDASAFAVTSGLPPLPDLLSEAAQKLHSLTPSAADELNPLRALSFGLASEPIPFGLTGSGGSGSSVVGGALIAGAPYTPTSGAAEYNPHGSAGSTGLLAGGGSRSMPMEPGGMFGFVPTPQPHSYGALAAGPHFGGVPHGDEAMQQHMPFASLHAQLSVSYPMVPTSGGIGSEPWRAHVLEPHA